MDKNIANNNEEYIFRLGKVNHQQINVYNVRNNTQHVRSCQLSHLL